MSHSEMTGMKTCRLGICKLKDYDKSPDEMFPFSENEKNGFQAIKNNRRRREYLAVRHLLQQMTGEKNEIQYSTIGKPMLKNKDLHISISHSPDLAVVLLSEEKAGVDVENIQRNIGRIAKRFLSKKELNDIEKSENPQLSGIIYWCAKEAAFKFSSLPGIDFKRHLLIHPFGPESDGGKFSGELCKEKPGTALSFHYFFSENNVIVCCVEEKKGKYI